MYSHAALKVNLGSLSDIQPRPGRSSCLIFHNYFDIFSARTAQVSFTLPSTFLFPGEAAALSADKGQRNREIMNNPTPALLALLCDCGQMGRNGSEMLVCELQ